MAYSGSPGSLGTASDSFSGFCWPDNRHLHNCTLCPCRGSCERRGASCCAGQQAGHQTPCTCESEACQTRPRHTATSAKANVRPSYPSRVRCSWLRTAAFVFRTLATPLKRAKDKRPAFKWPWNTLTPVLLGISFTAGKYRWPQSHGKSELPQWHQSQKLIYKSSASRLNRVLNETRKSPYLTHQATEHSCQGCFHQTLLFLEKQTWLLCSLSLNFLMRAREEWHMRKTEMSLIWVHHGARQSSHSPDISSCARLSLCFFLSFYKQRAASRTRCSLKRKVHLLGDTHEEPGLGFLVWAFSQDSHRACRLNSRWVCPRIGSQCPPPCFVSIKPGCNNSAFFAWGYFMWSSITDLKI